MVGTFQAVLGMAPKNAVNPKYLSGGQMLERPISKGIDEFPTNKSLYPLTQPIPKIEALAQTSGKLTNQKHI